MKWFIGWCVIAAVILLFNYGAHKGEIRWEDQDESSRNRNEEV